MANVSDQQILSRYQERFSFVAPQLNTPPAPDLSQVVVIPVHDEPHLVASLDSLTACHPTRGSTEVILVFNTSENAAADVKKNTENSRQACLSWMRERASVPVTFHILNHPDLPRKHAGVGLARKIGMDEAAARLARTTGLETGIITCFDADCTCAPQHLATIENHFAQHPRSAACSIYFEHPLEGSLPTCQYDAVAAYELHLRYHVEALRRVGFPHALHTIGSSMAVRAKAYLEQGGMNRRKAGEDFYFLQKIMSSAEVTELNETAVYPSARPSHRVPFGTGRAIQQVISGTPQTTYNPNAFEDLAWLVKQVEAHSSEESGKVPEWLPGKIPPKLAEFLNRNEISSAMEEISANVSTTAQFRKRFWRWFNGFRCMKFLNWVSENGYPRVEVALAASDPVFRQRIGFMEPSPTVTQLLQSYRRWQRFGSQSPEHGLPATKDAQ